MNKGMQERLSALYMNSMFLFLVCCLGIHVSFGIVFLLHHVLSAALVNGISVLVYIGLIGISRRKGILFIYSMVLLEINLYATIITCLMGQHTGAELYLLGMIPGTFFVTASRVKPKRYTLFAILPTLLNFAFLTFYIKALPHPDNAFLERLSGDIYAYNAVGVGLLLLFFSMAINDSLQRATNILHDKNRMLEQSASMDALTRLMNRRKMTEYLYGPERKNGADARYAVSIADIDDFKRINDTYGHDCGDFILCSVASILEAEAGTPHVARWGGEEFLFLYENVTERNIAEQLDHVRRRIRDQAFVYHGQRIPVTMTFGVSYGETVSRTRETLLQADHHLYLGKRGTKNCVVEDDAPANH